MMETIPPKLPYFKASIGGYAGISYQVMLIADNLLEYIVFDIGYSNPQTTLIPITPKDWQNFIQQLKIIGVTNWESHYENIPFEIDGKIIELEIMDGTNWNLEIRTPTWEKHSGGHNSYPDEKEFSQFLNIIAKLVKKPFC